MKRISIICFTGLLFLTACENSGSSTVGTYEKDETTKSSEKSESESHEAPSKGKTEGTIADTVKASSDAAGTKPGVSVDDSTAVHGDAKP